MIDNIILEKRRSIRNAGIYSAILIVNLTNDNTTIKSFSLWLHKFLGDASDNTLMAVIPSLYSRNIINIVFRKDTKRLTARENVRESWSLRSHMACCA